MNFTPFGTTFTAGTLPAGHQFTTAKFAQQVGTTASGQVVGLLSSDDQGVTYLRPVDTNGTAFTLSLPQASGNNQHNQIIALPINVQSKPGDMSQQQQIQIQVVNPANSATSGGDKYTLPLALQHIQQGQGCENIVVGVIDPNSLTAAGGIKMITLAYNPAQGGADGQGLHLQLQHTDENGEVHQQDQDMQQHNNNNNTSSSSSQTTQGMHCEEMVLPDVKPMLSDGDGGQAYPVAVVAQIPQELISVRQEDLEVDKDGNPKDKDKQDNEDESKVMTLECAGETYTSWQPASAVADYFNRLGGVQHPLNIHHFLKFSAETIKREQAIESSPLSSSAADNEENTVDMQQPTAEEQVDDPNNPEGKLKKKKKYKKKAPKPRRPRPGQVHIATALDGTTLFCCPECNMAYPDKELLEQHLVAHKIERRFICDICGAGLKRKEHLERHKLGHNPERPYICSVCCKGFKRKEHLNLHFVIHSGEKTEVCPECGKGFYRKDHLRKHARSHLAKRVKEELQQASSGVLQTGQEVDATTNTVVLPPVETHTVTPVALVQHHQQ